MSATQELKNSIQTKLEQSGEYDRYARALASLAHAAPLLLDPVHDASLTHVFFSCQAQGAFAAEADRERMAGQPEGVHNGCAHPPSAPLSCRHLMEPMPPWQRPFSVALLHPSPCPGCRCPRFAELIRSKGDTTMTVEQLTAEIIPRGRGACPGPHARIAPATPASTKRAMGSRRSLYDHTLRCALAMLTQPRA
jgi:hypothetical protein